MQQAVRRPMADSKCCFGCSNVRKGAWVIAIFDMLICILLTLKTLTVLNFTSYSSSYSFKRTHENLVHTTYGDETSTSVYGGRTLSITNDFNMFSQLFILFLFFYVNLNLRKATYMHNVQSINHWLVTNSIFFIFLIIYVGFTTLKYSTPDIILIGMPVCIVVVYQIYVVKSFYVDELKFLPTSEQNIGAQPASRGPPYMTITSQSVQANAAYPIQSTTAYPVQSGPYVIQQVHQPIVPTPFHQQSHQYHSQPQQQLPPQSHHTHPLPESYTPQEYCNPPPYSPNYNMSEGSSVKQ